MTTTKLKIGDKVRIASIGHYGHTALANGEVVDQVGREGEILTVHGYGAQLYLVAWGPGAQSDYFFATDLIKICSRKGNESKTD